MVTEHLYGSFDVFEPIYADFENFRFQSTGLRNRVFDPKNPDFDGIMAKSQIFIDISSILHHNKEETSSRGNARVRKSRKFKIGQNMFKQC